MKKQHLLFLAAAMLMFGCGKDTKELLTAVTIAPEAGTTYPAGKEIAVSLNLPDGLKIDSVAYTLDTLHIGSKKDASSLTVKTDNLPLGTKVITANVYAGGASQEVSTNIVLLAAKAPEKLTFTVEKVYPHDTTSYTEGLEYHDGYLYESDGGYLIPPNDDEPVTGRSSLRKVDLATGKVVKEALVDPKVFAEGITIIGDKILQLTYKEKTAYVYDKNTFKLLQTLNYTAGEQGWGLCFDGEKIYTTEGSNAIIFLDKNDYHQIGRIGVYDNEKQIDSVNELEFIDGKLYANVYMTDDILVIDPKTGAVLQKADLTSLYPKAQRNANADYFNGIAWDAKGKRLFVTGKNWDKLFQIKLSPAK
ncbi:glutaminyl-peptide cyclotransferase [Mucilaginibacter limnophilus]|uniref:Glutaminyl-peptide cyclotransferase n=1 Tax=Mucilaginibacter limnophilus TaxID=1932778 RepID=A0A3S2WZ08_9SPHI|nr:glutaminyl-peptide cyclotransferase [Mucilaginibacter limnophilus]RVU01461.1 glutaminyl-peptide cyclotransferase [Mucilaginibacter limnophilus]